MDSKNLDHKPKVEDFCQMFVISLKEILDFGKENHWLNLGLKNLWKIHRLAYEFCCFVTFNSGQVGLGSNGMHQAGFMV
jgi:hypothetical protein